jgi:hypothetical protein
VCVRACGGGGVGGWWFSPLFKDTVNIETI